MNKKTGILGLGILTVLLIGSFSFSVFAQDLPSLIIESKDNSNSAKFVPGQLIVGLEKPDPNFNAKASLHGGQVINSIDQINAHVVKVPLNTEEKFISAISHNPNVRYAERDAIVTASSVPNDPIYPVQWGMERVGMPAVWPSTFDLGSGIKIAVVDTGIYWDHPDLLGTNILTGFNFVDGNSNTKPTTICIDQNGIRAESHATFVTGIIAAATNNGEGVASIGKFDILPVRVLNQCGSGSSSNVASGIIYAADEGANVINLSLGSPVPSSAIEDAVNYAHAWPADVVIVAASGNRGTNELSYPAAYTNVISVGATSSNDGIASYSQFGPTLELSAPGGTSEPNCAFPATTFIVSTGVGLSGSTPIMQYSCGTGTSYAAPHVSAVAGLLKAANPSAENEEIRLHLQQTADDLGSPNYDIYFGHGLVRADLALSIPINPVDPDITPPVITVPSDVTLEAPADTTPANTGYATAIDAVDPSPTISSSDVESLDAQGIGTITRTWTATDSEGNSSSGDQVITVEDTTPPVITVPSDVTLEAPADTTPANTGYATAIDAVDLSPTISFNDADSLDAQGIGTITRTWTATDSEGNSSSGDQVITVEDIPPVVPSSIHVGDLNWQASNKKNWNAVVYITVHDGESLVSGVVVDATFTDPNNTSFSVNCTTVDGICKVNKTTKLDYLIFTVDSLNSTPVSELTGHHDADGDFDNSGIPTATINKGVNSVGDISDGGGDSGGGGSSWDCDAKPHPKKCPQL